MQEILLIRGGDCERVVDTLAVAAELMLSLGSDTQIDIAVPEGYAEYLSVSSVVRRVISVPSIDTEHGIEKAKSSGFGSSLFSAAKKLSTLTGKNVQAYWKMSEELRITEYDVVFDFDFSAFSIAVSKVAKTKKIIGFDPQNIGKTSKMPSLSAHETFHIRGEMSNSSRMRHLVARYFSYTPASDDEHLEWSFNTYLTPEIAPEKPYIVVGGKVPAPFMTLIKESTLSVFVVEDHPALEAQELTGLLQSAKIAIGNGVVSALASAVGITNLFIGSGQDAPHRAVSITTPSALASALPPLVEKLITGTTGGSESSEAASNSTDSTDSSTDSPASTANAASTASTASSESPPAPPTTSDDDDAPPPKAPTLKLKK